MSRHTLGVDPGISGAFALVDELGGLVLAADLPTVGLGTRRMVTPALLADIIAHWAPDAVCVAQVGAMPRQGLSSTFRFGKAVGVIEGTIGALKVPITFVAPATWRRHFQLVGRDKELSRVRAVEIWPAAASIYFARRKDHNKAESALIALWAVRVAVSRGAP